MSNILITAITSIGVFFLVTGIFYECLCVISRTVAKASTRPRIFMLILITGIFVAHVIAITIYASAYWFLVKYAGITALAGNVQDYSLVYLYYSATTYTSLGVGDIFPLGGLRLLTAIEALNGLILITWSAAFTYFGVQRMWNSHGNEKFIRSDYEKENN